MNIIVNGDLDIREQRQYVEYLEEKHGKKLETLEINIDGEFVDLHYVFQAMPFERIRRITGYLVGTMDNWNNAKTAEERDRVKHMAEDSTGLLEAI